jgi:hypothetical protein
VVVPRVLVVWLDWEGSRDVGHCGTWAAIGMPGRTEWTWGTLALAEKPG